MARWRSSLGVILLLAFPPLMGLVGFSRTSGNPGENAALPSTVVGLLWVCALNLGLFALAAVGIGFLCRLDRKELFAESEWRHWKTWAWGLGYSILLRIGLAFLMMTLVFGEALMRWSQGQPLDSVRGLRPQIENLIDPTGLRNPLYLFLATTLVSFVVAGLREELWRAALFAGMERWKDGILTHRWGRPGVILLAAVAFGLGHLPQGWGGVFLTGILGIGLGWILLHRRSLWVAVLAHGFFDAASFLMLRVVDALGLLEEALR